jgi:hypothetical protein
VKPWPRPIHALDDAVGGIEWLDLQGPHQPDSYLCSNLLAQAWAVVQHERLTIQTATTFAIVSRMPEQSDDVRLELRLGQGRSICHAIEWQVPSVSQLSVAPTRRSRAPRAPPAKPGATAQNPEASQSVCTLE